MRARRCDEPENLSALSHRLFLRGGEGRGEEGRGAGGRQGSRGGGGGAVVVVVVRGKAEQTGVLGYTL